MSSEKQRRLPFLREDRGIVIIGALLVVFLMMVGGCLGYVIGATNATAQEQERFVREREEVASLAFARGACGGSFIDCDLTIVVERTTLPESEGPAKEPRALAFRVVMGRVFQLTGTEQPQMVPLPSECTRADMSTSAVCIVETRHRTSTTVSFGPMERN